MRIGVGYTKGIPAEEMNAVREEGLKKIEEINDLFEAAFQVRMKRGANFKLLDINYMMPQIIDVETSLIPVQRDQTITDKSVADCPIKNYGVHHPVFLYMLYN